MDDLVERVKARLRELDGASPDATHGQIARAIIPMVLEEAAKVAEGKTQYRGRTIIAAAIRAIGAL